MDLQMSMAFLMVCGIVGANGCYGSTRHPSRSMSLSLLLVRSLITGLPGGGWM